MKRIVIKEKEWGGNTLLDQNSGKKCCLGFACLALGKSENEIRPHKMPSKVGVTNFSQRASKQLRARADEVEALGQRVEQIAAAANDQYHSTRSKTKRASYLAIMRQCFREAGFVFVLKRS